MAFHLLPTQAHVLLQGSLAGATQAEGATFLQGTVGVMLHAIVTATAAQISTLLVALNVSQTGCSSHKCSGW